MYCELKSRFRHSRFAKYTLKLTEIFSRFIKDRRFYLPPVALRISDPLLPLLPVKNLVRGVAHLCFMIVPAQDDWLPGGKKKKTKASKKRNKRSDVEQPVPRRLARRRFGLHQRDGAVDLEGFIGRAPAVLQHVADEDRGRAAANRANAVRHAFDQTSVLLAEVHWGGGRPAGPDPARANNNAQE